MYKNYTDDLFESILELAIYENSLAESEDYSEDEIAKTVIPESCDLKIHRIGRKVKLIQFLHTSIKLIGRVAAIIGIVIGISFSALLLSSEVRAACYNAVVTFYEKYVEILNHPTAPKLNASLSVEYIPEGYELAKNDSNEYASKLIYYNAEGERLFIQYYPYNSTLQADVEHYEIKDIEINASSGKIFITMNPGFSNILNWYSDAGTFTIMADLPEEELIKIAENIK